MGWEYVRARLGRVEGNHLQVDGRTVTLLPYLESGEAVEVVSTWLGAGAVYLNAMVRERTHLGLVAATAGGGAYAVYKVLPGGRRTFTGMRAITSGLATIPAGILADVSRNKTLPEVVVTGRAPADVKAIAPTVAGDLDRHPKAWAPANVTSMVVLSRLRGLTYSELMDVFKELRILGKLGDLLNLVRSMEFRSFLRARGVPWPYVLAYWEPGVQDKTQLFGGVMVGAGENIYQALELAAILMGAAFSDDLALKAREFYLGIGRLLEHPLMTMDEIVRALDKAFVDKLFRLEFFDAGRILGNLLVTLLTLPKAVASLPKLAANAARMVVTLTRISLQAAERLAPFLDLLKAALLERGHLTIGNGVLATSLGPDLGFMAAGKPPSVISRLDILTAARSRGPKSLAGAIDRAIQSLIQPGAGTPAPPALRGRRRPPGPGRRPRARPTGPAPVRKARRGGLEVDITKKQAERLRRVTEALNDDTKWGNVTPRDRWRLGRVYDKLMQDLVGEGVRRAGGHVLHYVEVTPELINELRARGGRVLITEGRLGSTGRFDMLEIDFAKGRAELLDLAATSTGKHLAKTRSYKTALEELLNLPVDAKELLYTGSRGELLEGLVEVTVQ
jgi:hypothetical protein